MTMASTTGKSSRTTAVTISRPMPGMPKICSTTSDPPISAPVLTPNTVTTENSDGRRACRNMIRSGGRPLARAMWTKSSCSVVIRSVRSSRW